MLVLEEEQTKIAVGDELSPPAAGNGLNHPPRVVGRFAGFLALDVPVGVTFRAYLGAKLLVEVLVVGLDEPLLVKEELAGLVLHAIVASVNSAIQPWDVVLVEVLAQVDHRVL